LAISMSPRVTEENRSTGSSTLDREAAIPGRDRHDAHSDGRLSPRSSP
jgi:hypothetical protein